MDYVHVPCDHLGSAGDPSHHSTLINKNAMSGCNYGGISKSLNHYRDVFSWHEIVYSFLNSVWVKDFLVFRCKKFDMSLAVALWLFATIQTNSCNTCQLAHRRFLAV